MSGFDRFDAAASQRKARIHSARAWLKRVEQRDTTDPYWWAEQVGAAKVVIATLLEELEREGGER